MFIRMYNENHVNRSPNLKRRFRDLRAAASVPQTVISPNSKFKMPIKLETGESSLTKRYTNTILINIISACNQPYRNYTSYHQLLVHLPYFVITNYFLLTQSTFDLRVSSCHFRTKNTILS